MVDLHGVFAPITTPFDAVTGDLDLIAMRRNVRTLLATDLSGLVLFGTTGEGLLLEEDERAAAIDGVREVLGGRSLLVAIGAESTRATIRRAIAAGAAGVDAVLVAPPSYYRPQMTAEALREHYLRIAEESPVPLVLYQVPRAYTGVELRSGLVAELANHPNIVGIKDSTGDLQVLGELVAACRREFAIMVGSGGILYGALEVGASGAIIAVADMAPEACCELTRLRAAGEDAGAGAIQERLTRLHKGVVGTYGVPGVKAALDLLGQVGGPPRMPLRAVNEKDRALISDVLDNVGLLTRDQESLAGSSGVGG
jgi:4-hydroxy-2-oxoglutarate aldolase